MEVVEEVLLFVSRTLRPIAEEPISESSPRDSYYRLKPSSCTSNHPPTAQNTNPASLHSAAEILTARFFCGIVDGDLSLLNSLISELNDELYGTQASSEAFYRVPFALHPFRALHYCAVAPTSQVLETVLYHEDHLSEFFQFDVQDRTADGCTPLHMAAARGEFQMVRVLVSCGADVRAVRKRYVTVLHDAITAAERCAANLAAEEANVGDIELTRATRTSTSLLEVGRAQSRASSQQPPSTTFPPLQRSDRQQTKDSLWQQSSFTVNSTMSTRAELQLRAQGAYNTCVLVVGLGADTAIASNCECVLSAEACALLKRVVADVNDRRQNVKSIGITSAKGTFSLRAQRLYNAAAPTHKLFIGNIIKARSDELHNTRHDALVHVRPQRRMSDAGALEGVAVGDFVRIVPTSHALARAMAFQRQRARMLQRPPRRCESPEEIVMPQRQSTTLRSVASVLMMGLRSRKRSKAKLLDNETAEVPQQPAAAPARAEKSPPANPEVVKCGTTRRKVCLPTLPGVTFHQDLNLSTGDTACGQVLWVGEVRRSSGDDFSESMLLRGSSIALLQGRGELIPVVGLLVTSDVGDCDGMCCIDRSRHFRTRFPMCGLYVPPQDVVVLRNVQDIEAVQHRLRRDEVTQHRLHRRLARNAREQPMWNANPVLEMRREIKAAKLLTEKRY